MRAIFESAHAKAEEYSTVTKDKFEQSGVRSGIWSLWLVGCSFIITFFVLFQLFGWQVRKALREIYDFLLYIAQYLLGFLKDSFDTNIKTE